MGQESERASILCKGSPSLIAEPRFRDGNPAASLPYRETEEFIRYALDSAAIVAVTDVRGTITFVNGKFCQITGYTQSELVGANHRILRSGMHDTEFFREMYRQIAQGKIWHGEICNRRKDGTLYWVATTIVPHISVAGKVDSYTAIRFDITPRKLIEEELRASKEHHRAIANLDALTGLPNRRRFQEYIAELVAEGTVADRRLYLALFDLDAFKELNDSFGHDAGDLLLQIIAERLKPLAQDRHFVARLGGDEFGLILDGVNVGEAFGFFEAVLDAVREPIEIERSPRRCSASMGISVFPEHGRDATSLFKAADMALYHAKSLGRDRRELFQHKLRERVEQRSATLLDIEHGLKGGEFRFFYQPIVRTSPNSLVSLEALMRWQHPTRGVITPLDFSLAFEDPAMRAALGMFMLEKVFNDMAVLRAGGVALGRVALNLTNSDFRSDAFLDLFFERCAATGIGPEQFCVEVTEGMFLGRDQKRVEHGLRRLHEAGVEVALDDFGTGYASLTHLQELPIDRLKIDRRFISNITKSSKDQAIVSGVINIAHGLGKVVTAEGVEDAEQVAMLLGMKCDFLQGWFFSKACDVNSLPDVISRLPALPLCTQRKRSP
ncbi:MAG: EAL domain-containing protein [Rhizobium sp.]|nr:EAL domain-containing protein [Rhizobium sp.]